jgi:hypothetical protein
MSIFTFIYGANQKKVKAHHEEKMAELNNAQALKLAETSDKTKIELAKLELEMKKAELESAEKIAKIEAEAMSKNQINDLRQYAGSNERRNYEYSGNSRGRGRRPFA